MNHVGLAQTFDEVRERSGTVGPLTEARIELQHGGFQEPELRTHFAAFQNLKGAFDQRHGLLQIEHRPAVSAADPAAAAA